MTARRLTLPEMLDALLERAARLRSAGVRRVELEGMAFEIDPPEQPGPQKEPEEGDIWADAPGFPRLRERRRGMEPEE